MTPRVDRYGRVRSSRLYLLSVTFDFAIARGEVIGMVSTRGQGSVGVGEDALGFCWSVSRTQGDTAISALLPVLVVFPSRERPVLDSVAADQVSLARSRLSSGASMVERCLRGILSSRELLPVRICRIHQKGKEPGDRDASADHCPLVDLLCQLNDGVPSHPT